MDLYQVSVKLLRDRAVIPQFAHGSDSCADLTVPTDGCIPPNATVAIPLGIAIHLPRWTEAQVRGRSGLAKKGLRVHDGTIDQEYRDEIHLIATNHGTIPFVYRAGDRLGQIAVRPVPRVYFTEGDIFPTKRGGLGSTGRGPLDHPADVGPFDPEQAREAEVGALRQALLAAETELVRLRRGHE